MEVWLGAVRREKWFISGVMKGSFLEKIIYELGFGGKRVIFGHVN